MKIHGFYGINVWWAPGRPGEAVWLISGSAKRRLTMPIYYRACVAPGFDSVRQLWDECVAEASCRATLGRPGQEVHLCRRASALQVAKEFKEELVVSLRNKGIVFKTDFLPWYVNQWVDSYRAFWENANNNKPDAYLPWHPGQRKEFDAFWPELARLLNALADLRIQDSIDSVKYVTAKHVT